MAKYFVENPDDILTYAKVAYEKRLLKLNEINRNTRYSSNRIAMQASGAGLCHLKHGFKALGAESSLPDDSSMRKMRLGTIVHEDIQEALLHNFQADNKVMCEIPIQFDMVKGHLDVAIEINQDEVVLIDIKTMGAFPWSQKYGRKKNDKAAIWNKIQLGTYALGLMEGYGYTTVYMYLMNYKKDNSDIRFEPVGANYIDLAEKYWNNVTKTLEDSEILIDGWRLTGKPVEEIDNVPSSPIYNWECKYCQYSNVCAQKLGD